MASNVPRFASFRPKPKAAPEPPSPPLRHTAAEPPAKEKDRSKSESSSTRAYFSDRRGDTDLWRYGSLNRRDTPPYRRYGHGFVLGLSADQKIDRANSTDKMLCITPATRGRPERLLTHKRAHLSNERALRLLKTANGTGDLQQDFMLLSANTKTRRHESSGGEDDGAPEQDYRRIQGPESTKPADPDTQYDSETGVSIDREVTRKNAELVRQTREHPEDAQGWLALIAHQEAMLKLERPSAELTASDKAHLADIRISTYEEALKKIGKDESSQLKLYKGLLEEAKRAWDGAKLASRWAEVLAKHPHSAHLWTMYLDFVQSRFTSFKYEDCRATFFKCIETLRTSTNAVPPAKSLHILLRLTSMTHEAGYQELALAVWQALLEFHLLLPPETDANMRTFEEFWDSEVPRIGEQEAKGWKHCNADDSPPAGPPSLDKRDASYVALEDFRKRELEAMNKLRCAGRTSDDTAEDDAFHTIFFSDLEPYLHIIPLNTPTTLIIEAFLCFCGLPPLPHLAAHQQEWWSDPFLQRQCQSASRHADESAHFKLIHKRFLNCPLKRFCMTTELLFEQDFPLDSIRLSADFIRRLLKLLAFELSSYDIIGEYLLAFELRHFSSAVFKTAKRLSKARPSSLRLYNAYGLVESHLGNSAKADQVFSMALSMQTDNTALSTPGTLDLFSNWVLEALHTAGKTEALWRLISPLGKLPAGATPVTPPDHALIQNACAMLSGISERALLCQNHTAAITSTSLFALSVYLSEDYNAERALETHHNLSAWFASHKLSNTRSAELHAQVIARFLTYHSTHAAIVKPAQIRTTLEPLIARFPANTILLSLYAANEARFSIDDRVRGIMHQSSLHRSDDRSVVSWVFAIHYETLKGETAGSTSHSIRALYKRCSGSTGAHCLALWNAYLRFELSQLQHELSRRPDKRPGKGGKTRKWEMSVHDAEQRVKETFYTGLRHVPWCKDYVMLAFTDAKDVFTEVEKLGLYRVIQEKELRLYVELDGVDA
ncbi:DUF1740-domain-containing protein [Decorospora gaudefroyi]|uniref:DUF1740-domain-containing protein n=1 Tax=Decorospora gaudefroyi TaxID=184978 RepID=A0A6A5JXD3_9PLEO|nr:DUF1740-domain-containing protein [Decorospora gaudefroyi]